MCKRGRGYIPLLDTVSGGKWGFCLQFEHVTRKLQVELVPLRSLCLFRQLMPSCVLMVLEVRPLSFSAQLYPPIMRGNIGLDGEVTRRC